jgi:chromosomal replication initiator protein
MKHIAHSTDDLKMDTLKKNWKIVQSQLKQEVGEATYNSWLSKLDICNLSNGILTLRAPTKFMKEWILTHYKDTIKKYWREIEPAIINIDILLGDQQTSQLPINDNKPTEPVRHESNRTNFLNEINLTSSLDNRFLFDNFVVGAPNELAYAAARSVADSSEVKSESNPLFLYGGVGLGKTHLMHAIAWHIHHNGNDRKVIYISAEKFMYSFVKALREKDIMSFKEYFRSVDVLMIDDVQFICGKDSTQEEFFHTFNALIDNNCQIVISADRSPSDLEGMEDRVKSRLGWGLVVDVHSTTYELRLGILHSKIEKMQIDIPKEVIEFLAAKITSNVRELEGALNKVVAHAQLVGKELNIEITQHILKDLLRSNEKLVTIEEIQKKVCNYFNIKLSDMSSSRRLRAVARPRQIAMYLSKNLTYKSLADIGLKFGKKDHTTVMHAIKNIENLLTTNIELKEDMRILMKIVQS